MGCLELVKGPWSQPQIRTGTFLYRGQSWWYLTGMCRSCWLILRCWLTSWRYGRTKQHRLCSCHFKFSENERKLFLFSSFAGTRRGRATRLPGALHCQWDGEPVRPVWSQLVLQSTQSGPQLLQPAERRKPAHRSCHGSLPHRLRSQLNFCQGWTLLF